MKLLFQRFPEVDNKTLYRINQKQKAVNYRGGRAGRGRERGEGEYLGRREDFFMIHRYSLVFLRGFYEVITLFKKTMIWDSLYKLEVNIVE